MMRRGEFFLACVITISMSVATAQTPAAPAPAANGPAPMLLWPGGAPGALGDTDDDKPTITAYIPASNPTKTAVVIAPGGGYVHLSMVKEGSDVAAWLNARGVGAFVLKYRLGPKYHSPLELGDAQRAIRTAGGHLTASAGTMFDAGNAAAADPIEQQSSRPDFLVLAYPVITMQDPYVHKGSRIYLLGNAPPQELMDAMSPEMHVTAQTPPTFLFSTT